MEGSRNKDIPDGTVANGGRRYTFLVEKVDQYGMTLSVEGNIHGKICEDDGAYLYHAKLPITLAKIIKIKINGTAVEEAEDTRVEITMNLPSFDEVPAFTVLSSIRPQAVLDAINAVENPEIVGMLAEFDRFSKDKVFVGNLIFNIAHSKYIMATMVGKNEKTNQDMIAYPSLKNSDGAVNLPLFTDAIAFSRWSDVSSGKLSVKPIVHTFQTIAKMCVGKNNSIVINPFGPKSFLLKESLISSIVNSEGYRKEFGENGDSVIHVDSSVKRRIQIGVLTENDQIRIINEVLISFGKAHGEIKSIHFLMKKEDGVANYLCVIDTPEEGSRKIFEQAYSEIRPVVGSTQKVDFSLPNEPLRIALENIKPTYVIV